MANQYSPWSEDDSKAAIKMFLESKSFSIIAKALNKTIGAVAGHINRKGIKRPSYPKERLPLPPHQRKSDPATLALNKKLAEKPRRVRLRLIESDTEVTFKELRPHHCRWPLGDPKRSDFRFCGCVKIQNQPYCEKHCVAAGKGMG